MIRAEISDIETIKQTKQNKTKQKKENINETRNCFFGKNKIVKPLAGLIPIPEK